MANNDKPTFADLQAALDRIRDEWPSLCTNPRLKFDAEKEWTLQACEKNDYSIKTALENIDAVCAALRNVAAVGVTLDPARKLAYVLPRDSKMVYDLSYMGLLHLATSSGALQWAQARIVHENDIFELSGYDAPPVHKFKPFGKPEERGPIVGAYVVVKTQGGDYLTNAMQIEEINAIRDRSPAWVAKKSGPWKTDWNEMAKKTTVKNAWKYWPDPSEALARAVHYLNTDGGQGIDTDGTQTRKALLEEWTGKLAKAQDGDAVAALWKEGRQEFKEDPEGYGQFSAAVAARNRELGVRPPPPPPPASTSAPTPASRNNKPDAAALVKTLVAGKATYAQIADVIAHAEDDATLEATGALIDGLPENQQGDLNVLYNDRLSYLNKKFGRPESE